METSDIKHDAVDMTGDDKEEFLKGLRKQKKDDIIVILMAFREALVERLNANSKDKQTLNDTKYQLKTLEGELQTEKNLVLAQDVVFHEMGTMLKTGIKLMYPEWPMPEGQHEGYYYNENNNSISSRETPPQEYVLLVELFRKVQTIMATTANQNQRTMSGINGDNSFRSMRSG